MPGQCEECGSDNVYWQILDEGVSDELYRCVDCHFTRDFPVTADTSTMRMAKDISASSGATMIMEIDQSNHPGLAAVSTGVLALASSGVCAMLTAHWIGAHFKYSKSQAHTYFKELLRDKLKQLAAEQTAYMKEMESRSILSKDFETAREAYSAYTGATTHPDKLAPPMGTGERAGYIDLGVQEKRRTLWDKAMLLQRVMKDAYQMEINRMSLNCAIGTEVFSDEPLNTLVAQLKTQTRIPSTYAINLAPVSGGLMRLLLTGSLSETGHVIGVQIDPPRFRLMDPNTGLWVCDSAEVLMQLLQAHLTEFYDVLGLFKAGRFTAWRF